MLWNSLQVSKKSKTCTESWKTRVVERILAFCDFFADLHRNRGPKCASRVISLRAQKSSLRGRFSCTHERSLAFVACRSLLDLRLPWIMAVFELLCCRHLSPSRMRGLRGREGSRCTTIAQLLPRGSRTPTSVCRGRRLERPIAPASWVLHADEERPARLRDEEPHNVASIACISAGRHRNPKHEKISTTPA